jgi:hypothetical protein
MSVQLYAPAALHPDAKPFEKCRAGCSVTQAKVKVKLLSALTEHHALKAYWKSGGIAPRILRSRD